MLNLRRRRSICLEVLAEQWNGVCSPSPTASHSPSEFLLGFEPTGWLTRVRGGDCSPYRVNRPIQASHIGSMNNHQASDSYFRRARVGTGWRYPILISWCGPLMWRHIANACFFMEVICNEIWLLRISRRWTIPVWIIRGSRRGCIPRLGEPLFLITI